MSPFKSKFFNITTLVNYRLPFISKILFYEKPAAANAINKAAELNSANNRAQAYKGLAGFADEATINQQRNLLRLYSSKLNTLRFVAICSIVWGHSLLGWEGRYFDNKRELLVQTLLMQFGRVGTVIFFIISGFFMASKFEKHSPWTYLKYRFRSIILPWVIFVCLCVFLQLFKIYSVSQLTQMPLSLATQIISSLFNSAIFYAAYWFIPVSLISACVLIAGKKYINNVFFAGTLAAITLFYSLNLYYGWVAVNHTKSFLGYAFFMWIGLQLNRNIVKANAIVEYIKFDLLVPAILAMFILACMEAIHLTNIGCADAYGSIRFTNIILSLLLFVFFLKLRSIYRIKKIKSQTYTYGVYLIHSLVLLEVTPFMLAWIKKSGFLNNIPILVAIQVLFFVMIISLCYFMSVVIKHSRLKFLIGR